MDPGSSFDRVKESDTGSRHPSSAQAARATALLGILCLVVVMIELAALHVFRSDLDPRRRHLSEYAVGELGGLMSGVFGAAGVGVLALSISFWRSVVRTRTLKLGCSALWLAAASDVLMAMFPTDLSIPGPSGQMAMTISGRIHNVLAVVHAVGWVAAAIAVPLALRCDRRRISALAASVLTGAAVLVALAARAGASPGQVGTLQRVWIATILVWGFVHGLIAWRGSVQPQPSSRTESVSIHWPAAEASKAPQAPGAHQAPRRGEAACRGRCGGGSASPTSKETQSLSDSCSGSEADPVVR